MASLGWLNEMSLKRVGILVTAAAEVVLDVRSPTYLTTTLTEPAIYATLRAQPPGAVAEYPLMPSVFGPYDQLYRQDFHHRRLLNGFDPDSAEERRAMTLAPMNARTAAELRRLAIRYVVLEPRRAIPADMACPGKPTSDFRLIAGDGRFELFRVVGAPPASPSE